MVVLYTFDAILYPVEFTPQKSVWEIFCEECPGISEAYTKLSQSIVTHGGLDEKTRLLILVGIYSTTRDPVALRHFVGLALKAGIPIKQIEAAALLAFNTGVTNAELAIPIIVDMAKG
jgi:alkylhydroperoxidase/carboxymuconolactone decarboxylase family protein YurZ